MVYFGECGYFAVDWIEAVGVCLAYFFCVGNKTIEEAIVVWAPAHYIRIKPVCIPWGSLVWIYKGQCFCAEDGDGGSVEVEFTLHLLIH